MSTYFKKSILLFFLCAAHALTASNIDSLTILLHKEQEQANHLKQVKLLMQIGKAHSDNNNYAEAFLTYDKALPKAKKIKAWKCYRTILSEKGDILMSMGQFQKAIDVLRKLVEEIKSKEEGNLGEAYSQLAEACQGLGNNELAYDYHLLGLQRHEEAGDSIAIAGSLYSIGSIFYYQDNLEIALEYFEKTSSIGTSINSGHYMFTSLCAISGVYNQMNEIEKSLEYNKRAALLGKKLGNVTGLAYVTMNLGANYAAIGEHDKAIAYYEESLPFLREVNDASGELSNLRLTGEALVKKGEFEKSYEYLEKAMEIGKLMGERPRLLEIQRSFAMYYEAVGDYKMATEYTKKYAALKDSLSNEATLQKMSNSKSRYEVLQHERLLAIKDAEFANQQKSFLLYGVGILCICMWLLYRQNKFKTKSNKILAEKNAKIQAQNQQLEQSNIELKRFAYIASHDLKEPLRSIGSYANLLQRRYKNKLDSDADEFLDYITSSTKRLYTLLNDVLHLSKIDLNKNELTLTDSNEAITIANDNLRQKIIEKNAKISIGSLPKITADKLHLVQLFQNLIDNSIKYSDNTNPLVEIESHKKDGFYEFSIKDNGIGIEPDYQQKVFEMFKRLHNQDKYEGSGVGLAICKKIVQQYGGEIWVESRAGKGSTFYFTFPVPLNGC